jgi:hypothetical protein
MAPDHPESRVTAQHVRQTSLRQPSDASGGTTSRPHELRIAPLAAAGLSNWLRPLRRAAVRRAAGAANPVLGRVRGRPIAGRTIEGAVDLGGGIVDEPGRRAEGPAGPTHRFILPRQRRRDDRAVLRPRAQMPPAGDYRPRNWPSGPKTINQWGGPPPAPVPHRIPDRAPDEGRPAWAMAPGRTLDGGQASR